MDDKSLVDIECGIMNIQIGDVKEILLDYFVTAPKDQEWKAIELAYKIGHRDARHAACEIVFERRK